MRTLPCCLGAALATLSSVLLPAQSRTVVPAIATDLPGNAAVSLPLRWSQGTMIVSIDAPLLPAALTGQTITGLRLRRPSFLREPAYPAVQRTIAVWAGFTPRFSRDLSSRRGDNWPTNPPGGPPPANNTLLQVLPPTPISVLATTPPTAPQTTGDEFLLLSFATPLPVVTGNLLLEFEVSGATFAVDSQWVDAVWSEGGVESGYAVPVGVDTCTTRSLPLRLMWTGATGPARGVASTLQLTGAPPTTATSTTTVVAWVGFDPQTRAPGAGNFGFGASLAILDPNLAGCFQWAPTDALWVGTANAAGAYSMTFTVPAAISHAGQQIGAQAAYLDMQRPGFSLSVANGVLLALDRTGLGNGCATVLIPGLVPATGQKDQQSPWLPDIGLMPVLVVEY